MARRSRSVEVALDRWLAQGLLTPAQAQALREEEEAFHGRRTRRWGQIALGILGAFALVQAGGVFLARNWELLSYGTQTAILILVGGAAYAVGLWMHRREGWRYPGALLQAGGFGLVLSGVAYSDLLWDAGTPGAMAMGVGALAFAGALAPVSFRQGQLMVAVHTVLILAFLGLFLDRAFALEFDAIVWILDAVVVVAVGVQYRALGRWDAEWKDRALIAFAASLWAGLVLAVMTGFGPLEGGVRGALGMDLWMLLVTGLTLWGLRQTSDDARRDSYEINLALCVLVGGLLAMFTLAEPMDLGSAGAFAGGGVVAALGLTYGLLRNATRVLVGGALVGLFATWVFSVDQGGAVGGALALLISAVVLFWISTRIRAEVETDGGPAVPVDGPPGPP